MTATTTDLIIQSWMQLGDWAFKNWSAAAKQVLEADTPQEQTAAVNDTGGLAVTSAMNVGVTLLEVIEYLAEPIENRVMTQAAMKRTSFAGDVPHICRATSDFEHQSVEGDVIKRNEVLFGTVAVTGDPNLWVTTFTWVNGRTSGMHLGTIEVCKADGTAAEPHTTYINV